MFSSPWPNTLDLITIAAFLALVILLPGLGYVFMVLDFRAYLRSLRRGLVLASQAFRGVPHWARSQTPRSIAAMGLMMPCTVDDLKQAYRQKVMQLHPDRGGDQRRFLRLQAEFEEALGILTQLEAARQADSDRSAA